MKVSLFLAQVVILFAVGCAGSSDQGEKASAGQPPDATKSYQFEIPGELKENESVFVTSGDKTFECRRSAQGTSDGKVQCAPIGMALHQSRSR